MANGWGGLRNPPGGRPPGSGDPLRRALRLEQAEVREAREALAREICGTERDPLRVLAALAADPTQEAMTRIVAARTLAPFLYSQQPAESRVEHQHISVDAETLRMSLLQRLDALASAARPPVVIDAEPALPEPEPEQVD